MDLIGVIDLQNGGAVHARGGDRATYGPVRTAAGLAIEGDPTALATLYVERLGVDAVYVADLDAINGGRPQSGQISAISGIGVPVWVDAGVTSVDAATAAIACGAAHVIVGLETLKSFDDLAAIGAALGNRHVAFSLDLRHGRPMLANGASFGSQQVDELARRAVAAGAGALIVLDVARVGMAVGVDLALLRSLRHAAPDVTLVAGGGVRDDADLRALDDAGCDAVLVATALHDGRLTPRHRVSR